MSSKASTSTYWADMKEELKRVRLPMKTTCKRCQKVKAISNFSNQQLDELRRSLYGNPKLDKPTVRLIACRPCLETSRHEMECCVCDQVKSLEGFTKAQRRNRDNARCIECVNNQGTTEPGIEFENDSSDDDSDGRSSVTNPYDEDEFEDFEPDGLTSTVGGISLKENTDPHAMPNSDDDLYAEPSDDECAAVNPAHPANAWRTFASASTAAAEAPRHGPASSVAPSEALMYNSRAGTQRRSVVPSVASTVPRSQAGGGSVASNDDGRRFAKVRVTLPEKIEDRKLVKPTKMAELAKGRKKDDASDSDTDSDFGTV